MGKRIQFETRNEIRWVVRAARERFGTPLAFAALLLPALAGCGQGDTSGGGGIEDFANDSLPPREDPNTGEQWVRTPDSPSSATACTANNQCPTGFCVDGFCCDAKCDYPCMACSAAKKGSGVDGVCGSIAYDTDPDNDCPVGACDGKNQCKNYNGVACTSAAGCLSNYCVDGVCCGNICMGSCQACSAAKKGGGYDGSCGSIKAATDPDNECNPGECNGSGACNASPQPLSANGAVCTSAAQCQSGYCADGVCCESWCLGTCMACSAAKKGGGADGTCGFVADDKDFDNECWAGACNGAGVCKQYNGLPCTDKSQCLSNYCVDGVCCGNTCNQFCTACTTAKKGYGYDGVCEPIASGRDLENECNPGECNGSAACNQPQTPQANGTTCVSGGQCASGNCADGVCCDTACSGSCTACTAAKKGSGVDGTCGNIKAETDPDKECGVMGRCGGSGVCRYYNGAPCTSTAQCFSSYCVDGACCGNVCTNSCMACSSAKKGYGYDGVCENIVGGRDPDNECNPGECSGSGACNQPQTPQPNGAACLVAAQCVSGNCVDGVCCDTACTGGCQACTAAKKGTGTNGTCGDIKYDTDPDNECANGACSGTGTCKYYNGMTCTTTAECLSNYCVDGFCCGNICTNTCMACSAAKKGGGTDGVCAPIAANTDPDNECYLMCGGSSACQPAPNGAPCAKSADCASTYCVDGVCCGNACTGTCQACTTAKKGSGVDGQCGPIATNTDPDNECPLGKCDGASVCTVLTANGTQCSMDSQCASEHCVDGVCCDTACTGACVACHLPGTVGTCSPIPLGQQDLTASPACTGICDGNGACVRPTGWSCSAGSDCETRTCDHGLCSATPPDSDFLVWRTIYEIQPGWAGPYPVMSLKKIVGTDSGYVAVNGDTSDVDQTPSVLNGGFTNRGAQALHRWNGSSGTYHYFWEKLYKAGPEAASASYQKVTQFTCSGNWGQAYSTFISGNRAGWTVHTADTCAWFGSVDFGDGIPRSGPTLIRITGLGTREISNIPAGMTPPLAYGPSFEIYSVALSGGMNITKFPAAGGATTTKTITGSVQSVAFDVDSQGNLLLAFGFTGSINPGAGVMTASGTDLGLVKLDPNGNVLWQKRYPASITVTAVALTSEDGFTVFGGGSLDVGDGTLSGNFSARFSNTGTPNWSFAGASGYVDANGAGAVFAGSANGTTTVTMAKYNKCNGTTVCKGYGASCTNNDQCGSGFCVDGVCCDDACTGTCKACTAAKTGLALDGTCAAIVTGTDPDNECPTGSCNGSAACTSVYFGGDQ